MEKQMTISKLNIFEKLKWKFQYRDLDKICGQHTALVTSLLKNSDIQSQYKNNKEEILSTLKRTKDELPNRLNEVVDALLNVLSNEVTPDTKNELNASLDEMLNNVNVMLNIKGFGGDVNEYIVNQVTAKDLTQINMSNRLRSLLPLNDYSEDTKRKYPLNILQKLLPISDKDLNSIDSFTITNAVKNNIPAKEIQSYIQLQRNQLFRTESDVKLFLQRNMQFSSFFLEYNQKYHNHFPSYEIEDYFPDTRNMSIKEEMYKLRKSPEFYRTLRDKWFDYRLEQTPDLKFKKGIIEKKYFNMDYSNIEEILQDGKIGNFSKETQSTINAIKHINDIKDINSLMTIDKQLEQIRDTINIGKPFDEVYNFYAGRLLDGTFKVEEFSGERSSIEYDGKNIDILKLTGEDYKGVIHCLGGRAPGSINLTNEKARDTLPFYENPSLFTTLQQGSSLLSSSIQKDDQMAFFSLLPDTLFVGLELDEKNILSYSNGDAATPTSSVEYSKNIEKVQNSKVSSFFANHYDELVSSRYKQTDQLDLIDKNDRIPPKYLLTFKRKGDRPFNLLPSMNYNNLNDKNTKRLLHFASEYNIPIVEMDTEAYENKFKQKYDQLKQKVQEGLEDITPDDLYNLSNYKSSIEFFNDNFSNQPGLDVLLDILPNLNLTEKNAHTMYDVIKAYTDINSNYLRNGLANLSDTDRNLVTDKLKEINDLFDKSSEIEY